MREIPGDLAPAMERLGLHDARMEPLDTGWGQRFGLYLVTDGTRRVVLKRSERAVIGTVPLLGRLASAMSMRLECATYLALEGRTWRYLRHPRLLDTDGRRYLVLEYVPSASRRPPDLASSLVPPLLEFQVALSRLPHLRFVRLLQGMRPRSPWRVMLAATVGGVRGGQWSSTFRTWRVYISSRLAVARSGTPRLAQHGDVTRGNVVVDRGGGLHLIDFQRVMLGQKLVFRDVVQLAVDPSQVFGFDVSALRAYAHRWCFELARPAVDARGQLRAALLLQVLYILHTYADRREEYLARYRRFLREILLPDQAFERWVLEQVLEERTS